MKLSLISKFSAEAIVVIDPIGNVINGVFRFRFTDDHFLDACVEYEAFAHHAGANAARQLTRLGIDAGHIERGAEHFVAVSGDDGVGFRMNGAAHLVAFAAGNAERVTHTVIDVGAVFSASRRTVVARRDDDIIFDDDRAVMLAQTGASSGNGFCDI